MDSARRATCTSPAAEALEFIRFCYRRRGIGWPELYDEMCAVAFRGRFRGWGADELASVGIGFTLPELPALAAMAARVVAEETAAQQSQRAEDRRGGHSRGAATASALVTDATPEPRADGEARPGVLLAPGAA